MAVKIFFCYAHEDEALLNKLKTHLRPLQRQGLIDVWHDRDISAGTEWEQEIKQHLNEAKIILLLVSPDFINSDYCYGIEMKLALERHQRGEARVIPIILRPVYWQGILGNLQALPTDAKPVRIWPDEDQAFFDVAEGIRKVVEQLGPIRPEAFSLLRTLTGHTHIVTSVAFSPDGQTLASSSWDRMIKLWKVATGQELHTLTGYTHFDSSVAFSPDGQTLASSGDSTIRLWSVATGQEMRTLTGDLSTVLSVAFSPDGQTLASSDGSTIRLWSVATGQEMRTLTGYLSTVLSVAFSPDGQTLASSDDSTIKLWNVATGQEMRTLSSHRFPVLSVAFSPNGQTLASGSEDATIKLWNVATGQEMRTIELLRIRIYHPGHSYSVLSVAFSPDGQTLASNYNEKIKLWNLTTGQEVHTLTGHTEAVYSVAFSPNGQTLASGSIDKTIKIWGKK